MGLINDLENWKFDSGIYRYSVCSSITYEIHITCYDYATDILNARANLYVLGKFYTKDGGTYMARWAILLDVSVPDCIQEADRHTKKLFELGDSM